MKYRGPALLLALLMILGWSEEPRAASDPDVMLSSTVIPQGDVGLIRIPRKGEKPPGVFWMDREVLLVPDEGRSLWTGFIGVDLTKAPGRYPLVIKGAPSAEKKEISIEITKKEYGVRRLTLPKKMVDLDPETLKRVRKESEVMKGLWWAPPTLPLWRGDFYRPVPGEVVGPFGRKSVINKQPRSPHSGVDLRGEKGTPIKSINNGRVILTAEHFFTGFSIVIDHGGGIQSMYFHLDEIKVRKGQTVKRGDVIGLVGASGRSTGPHLHWGVRINGARVDPVRLTALSSGLDE